MKLVRRRNRYLRIGREPRYGSLKRLWHWRIAGMSIFLSVGTGWVSLTWDPLEKGVV